MEQPTISDEELDRRMEKLFTKPWAPWFRKLLGNIFKMYCSTLDAKMLGEKFERHIRMIKSPPLTLVERARFNGHLTAFLDFVRASESPEFVRAKERAAEFGKMLPELFGPTEELSFQDREIYHREFAHAYGRTVESNGNGFGRTDASRLYLGIALHSMMWLRDGKPRSIAEFNRQIFAAHPRPAPKTPLEKLRQEGEIKTQERQLQQLCDRLGLHLRPRNTKLIE